MDTGKGKEVAGSMRKLLSFTTKTIRTRPIQALMSKWPVKEVELGSGKGEEETDEEQPMKKHKADSRVNLFNGAIESFEQVST